MKRKNLIGILMSVSMLITAGVLVSNQFVEVKAQDNKIKEVGDITSTQVIKGALRDFPTYSSFVELFPSFNDENWVVLDMDATGDVRWKIYPSKSAAPNEGENGVSAAKIREELMLKDTKSKIAKYKTEEYEKISYSNSTQEIFGDNQDIKVTYWSLERQTNGDLGLKIDFTLKNKTEGKIDLGEFAKNKFIIHQKVNNKAYIKVDFISNNLKGNVVAPDEKMSGTIFVRGLNTDEQMQSFIFGISRVEGDGKAVGLSLNV